MPLRGLGYPRLCILPLSLSHPLALSLSRSLSVAMPNGPPKCADCPTDTTRLVSAKLLETWEAERGLKWDWHTPKSAYWLRCLECHVRQFPEDKRVANRYSEPRALVAKRLAMKKCGCTITTRGPWAFIGEFYLTTPPPETLRPSWEVLPRWPHLEYAAPTRLPRRARGVPEEVPYSADPFLDCVFAAFSRTAEPRAPPLRSCLAGSRGFKLDRRLGRDDDEDDDEDGLGPVWDRRSRFSGQGPLSRSKRVACKREEFIIWEGPEPCPDPPTCPYAGDWPSTCDVEDCTSELPAGKQLEYSRFIIPSSAPDHEYIAFLCASCHTRMLAGVAPRLRGSVYGLGVRARLHYGPCRVAWLFGQAAARGPFNRTFTPKVFGGNTVVRPDEVYAELKLRWNRTLEDQQPRTVREKDDLLQTWLQTLAAERQRRDAAAAATAAEPPPPQQLAAASSAKRKRDSNGSSSSDSSSEDSSSNSSDGDNDGGPPGLVDPDDEPLSSLLPAALQASLLPPASPPMRIPGFGHNRFATSSTPLPPGHRDAAPATPLAQPGSPMRIPGFGHNRFATSSTPLPPGHPDAAPGTPRA